MATLEKGSSDNSVDSGHSSSLPSTTANKKYTSPFSQFNISSTDVLDTIQKQHCPTCNKNVRYFCNKCLHLVNCPEDSVPQLKLPIKIDVIKHEQEREGKSTALHAKILAPQDVEVYGWKDMPKYEDVDRLLLLFPSPVITIAPHETLFWRHQRKPDDHLATIEAIYYFLREYHETYLSAAPEPISSTATESLPSPSEQSISAGATTNISPQGHVAGADTDTLSKVITPHKEWIDSHQLGPYTNQFDDMLWFYKYFYELIQRTYRERTDGREFTMKHKKGYIHYEQDSKQAKDDKADLSQTTIAEAVEAPESEARTLTGTVEAKATTTAAAGDAGDASSHAAAEGDSGSTNSSSSSLQR
ncbi:DTW domain-containing protein 1 [Mortierella claussenii]|nr:DTW domain-containing protein 1 [Mortierella claussenii]